MDATHEVVSDLILLYRFCGCQVSLVLKKKLTFNHQGLSWLKGHSTNVALFDRLFFTIITARELCVVDSQHGKASLIVAVD